MTIGTSIICGSLFCRSLLFTFTPHSAPTQPLHAWGGFERGRVFSGLTRTGDTENRGSFRCGFCSGFYRGPHPVSNERGPLPKSVSTDVPALRVRDSTRPRPPQSSPTPQRVPVATTTSHPAPPDRAGLPASAAGPSSSCPPSSCPAPPERAVHVPDGDRSAGPPATPALRNRFASPVRRGAYLLLRARQCACALLPRCRESVCAPAPGFRIRPILWRRRRSVRAGSSA